MSHRSQITLTDAQYERLVKESQRSGLARAELVRRALDHVYGNSDAAELKRAVDGSFGAWKDRDFDGESYVEGMGRGMGRRSTSSH